MRALLRHYALVDGPSWEEGVRELLRRDQVPAAQATGRLLATADSRWRERVVARTSMHDLLFTVPGQAFPFEDTVRVSWAEGVFEFLLRVEGGKLVTADRCLEENASAVLDSFLSQLVGDA